MWLFHFNTWRYKKKRKKGKNWKNTFFSLSLSLSRFTKMSQKRSWTISVHIISIYIIYSRSVPRRQTFVGFTRKIDSNLRILKMLPSNRSDVYVLQILLYYRRRSILAKRANGRKEKAHGIIIVVDNFLKRYPNPNNRYYYCCYST